MNEKAQASRDGVLCQTDPGVPEKRVVPKLGCAELEFGVPCGETRV